MRSRRRTQSYAVRNGVEVVASRPLEATTSTPMSRAAYGRAAYRASPRHTWRVHVTMVGLTGGIGAGKSAVARRLAERGAVIIDADQLVREVVAPGTDGLKEVVAAFGDSVLGPDGGLDRAAMGRLIFGDDGKRRTLEGIIHPRVRARTAELIEAAPHGAVVVNDVPLLVEAGLARGYQIVIVVEAPPETRIARLVGDRGMSEEEARARIAAQASDEQRRTFADVLIINDGSLADLHAKVDAAWDAIVKRAAENS
jgi:dephospho-CoA kinase